VNPDVGSTNSLKHPKKPQRPLSPGVSGVKRGKNPLPGLGPLRNPHRAYLRGRGFDSGMEVET